jgi:hypothetical protein
VIWSAPVAGTPLLINLELLTRKGASGEPIIITLEDAVSLLTRTVAYAASGGATTDLDRQDRAHVARDLGTLSSRQAVVIRAIPVSEPRIALTLLRSTGSSDGPDFVILADAQAPHDLTARLSSALICAQGEQPEPRHIDGLFWYPTRKTRGGNRELWEAQAQITWACRSRSDTRSAWAARVRISMDFEVSAGSCPSYIERSDSYSLTMIHEEETR